MGTMITSVPEQATYPTLPKSPTGIWGLDEVTGGGLPTGRPTLVTGAAGCGKTLLGVEFLVHGALDYGEPGVLLVFEENAKDLAANVRSLGFDLEQMERDGLLVVDAFRVDPTEIVETGAYDLEGLFIRLAYAVDSIGAKRVVLDTIEVLFGALQDTATIRSEVARLFRWIKDRGLTAIVTGEQGLGPNAFTRHGIEEYVSDCVIVLDHRVRDEMSTRRLRVVKYRGSLHGTNEYPFLITDRGVAVLPLSSLGLAHDAPTERASTGIDRLDHMLGGGVFRGSSTLISGEAGTGKTTLAAKMVEAACRRGERALFVSFEESPAQLVRDMSSVGIDFARWMDAGLLRIWAGRPSAYGLELHLVTLLRIVDEFAPTTVALDAMTALAHVGNADQVISAVTREVDLLKGRGITSVATIITHVAGELAAAAGSVVITSMMDTWLLLRNVESGGERNRLLFVCKSRGSAHSNQVREFTLTADGAQLIDVYAGPDGVLAGSARLAREATPPPPPPRLRRRKICSDGHGCWPTIPRRWRPTSRRCAGRSRPRRPSSSSCAPPTSAVWGRPRRRRARWPCTARPTRPTAWRKRTRHDRH
jgi:circadian clock protein KaiC